MISLTIIIVVLLAFIGFREYQTYKERDELLKKIMSKSYIDYMAGNTMVKPTRKEREVRAKEQEERNIEENIYKDPGDLSVEEQEAAIEEMNKPK